MERDHIDENPQHKALGAFFAAWALFMNAVLAPLPWWAGLLLFFVAWIGLIKVAGLKIRWGSYPEW